MTILVTGGAGFVGSSLALFLKEGDPGLRVLALDNLRRRGSELNLRRLQAAGVEFVHGDIRNREDLELPSKVDLVVECSAEPSVLAGLDSSPEYVLRTNLVGTLNLLEVCRRHDAGMIFLSTSRVYPIAALSSLALDEGPTRFEIASRQELGGVSTEGIAEEFPLAGARSLYGATKLASELFIEEYAYAYGVPAVIDRCGVIAGPWQMGRVDQGFVVLWVAGHVYERPLRYIGFGGSGKQVRDVLHIADLCELIALQVARLDTLKGQTFNVGGGRSCSVSLLELTELCRDATGTSLTIRPDAATRRADVPLYVTDAKRVRAALEWTPSRNMESIVADVHTWIRTHQRELAGILA